VGRRPLRLGTLEGEPAAAAASGAPVCAEQRNRKFAISVFKTLIDNGAISY
jgi:hypothetical protein